MDQMEELPAICNRIRNEALIEAGQLALMGSSEEQQVAVRNLD